MNVDLKVTPMAGIRHSVLSALLRRGKGSGDSWVNFEGLERKKLGTAIAHLRRNGWPIEQEWLSHVNPTGVITMKVNGSSIRKGRKPEKVFRAKVYRMTESSVASLRTFVASKGMARVGHARWETLKQLGLAEAG